MNDSDDHRRAAFSDAAANRFDWTPLDPDHLAADLAAGHPHYRITEYLSHGGMGAVYRATDNRPESLFTDIAIKFIRHDLKDDAEYLERFEKEISTLQRITADAGNDPTPHHQGIIRILDHGRTHDGVPFLVMPFLEGETLADLLEKPRLDETIALRLMGEICTAAAHAHSNRVIHRDLNPKNIYLISGDDDEFQPVILDFGIARTRQSATDRPTIPGQFHGTSGYTAPEVIRGEAASYPADVFALGKILVQLLNGNNNGVPIPASLESIILKATSDPIGLRFQTAGEFAKSLEFSETRETFGNKTFSVSPDVNSNTSPDEVEIKFNNEHITINQEILPEQPKLRDLVKLLGTCSRIKSTTWSVYESNSGPPYKSMFYWDGLEIIAFCHGDNEESIVDNLYLPSDGSHDLANTFSGKISLHEEAVTSCSTLKDLESSKCISLFTSFEPCSIPVDCGFSENGSQLRMGFAKEEKKVSTIGFHFPPPKDVSERRSDDSSMVEAKQGHAHANASRMLGPLLSELSPTFRKKVSFENNFSKWGILTVVPIGALFAAIGLGVMNWEEGMVSQADSHLLGWLKYLGSIIGGLFFGAIAAFAGVWVLMLTFWGLHQENINGTELKFQKLELEKRLRKFSDDLPPHEEVTSMLKMASSRATTESHRWPFDEDYRRRKCWGESGLFDYCIKLYQKEILSEKK